MEIKSSQEAAFMVAEALHSTGIGYCHFELGNIGGVLPVSGSSVRDGMLAGAVGQSLNAWGQFLNNRGNAAIQMGQIMAQTDVSAARSLRRG